MIDNLLFRTSKSQYNIYLCDDYIFFVSYQLLIIDWVGDYIIIIQMRSYFKFFMVFLLSFVIAQSAVIVISNHNKNIGQTPTANAALSNRYSPLPIVVNIRTDGNQTNHQNATEHQNKQSGNFNGRHHINKAANNIFNWKNSTAQQNQTHNRTQWHRQRNETVNTNETNARNTNEHHKGFNGFNNSEDLNETVLHNRTRQNNNFKFDRVENGNKHEVPPQDVREFPFTVFQVIPPHSSSQSSTKASGSTSEKSIKISNNQQSQPTSSSGKSQKHQAYTKETIEIGTIAIRRGDSANN